MKKTKIRLRKKQLDILFPNKFTKMRAEDFSNIVAENIEILNKREHIALLNIKNDILSGKLDGHEFYAKKIRGGIELVPFDDD